MYNFTPTRREAAAFFSLLYMLLHVCVIWSFISNCIFVMAKNDKKMYESNTAIAGVQWHDIYFLIQLVERVRLCNGRSEVPISGRSNRTQE